MTPAFNELVKDLDLSTREIERSRSLLRSYDATRTRIREHEARAPRRLD
jgi:hypothetical protein